MKLVSNIDMWDLSLLDASVIVETQYVKGKQLYVVIKDYKRG